MNRIATIIDSAIESARRLDPSLDVPSWIRRNRLEPMIYGIDESDLKLSREFIEECRQSYMNMLGHVHHFTHESKRLVGALTQTGVDCFVWRGIEYGRRLYEDPALRYFADLDLMISPDQRWSALHAAEHAGYRLRNGFIPRWFMARHHHHWPMISNDGRVPLEIHWAVDNPCRDLGLNDLTTGAQDEFSMLLLACLHAEKESRLEFCLSERDAGRQLLLDEPILPWLDLAVMMDRATPATLTKLAQSAANAPLREVITRSVWIVRTHFGVSVAGFPEVKPAFRNTALNRWRLRLRQNQAARFIARSLDCRPDVIMDWFGGSGRDGAFFLARVWQMAVLMADGAACAAWVLFMKVKSKFMGATAIL